MKVTITKDIPLHIFKPTEFGGDWCEICEQNFRHPIHLREGETAENPAF